MNIKNKLKKIKNNKLNIATIFVTIISIFVYFIGFIVLKLKDYEISNLLSMSADYVTLCSCVIVLIQLIAFVKDSRYREFRNRKESALKLAKEYAENILTNMAYIKTVFCIDYNSDNQEALIDKLCYDNVITSFTYEEIEKNRCYNEHKEFFFNKNEKIDMKILVTKSVIYNISVFQDVLKEKFSEEELSEIINSRFRDFICDTMNILEYFAMSVNENVAESDMLFDSLHQTFLVFVKVMYPFICNLNRNNEESYYSNIIKLYMNWSDKKNKIEKINQKNRERLKDKIKKEKERTTLTM